MRVAAKRQPWTMTRAFVVRPVLPFLPASTLRVTARGMFEMRLACGAAIAPAVATGLRRMSESAGATKKSKAELQEEAVFLKLGGDVEAHTVKINREQRYLIALEATMKILEKDLIAEVPGAFMGLNDKGLQQISWPVGKESAVDAYLAAHEFTAVDAGFVYQGAFAVGVKRVKIMSLFSLVCVTRPSTFEIMA
jgi:hypothetical protein